MAPTANDGRHTPAAKARRPHTGRRRNEQARQAVLQAMVDLLLASDTTAITVEALAVTSGVSKQTIYRWWPSKAAIVVEALSEHARERVPDVETGSVLSDLTAFLIATFEAAGSEPNAQALRTLMTEAQADPHAAQILHAYTAERREAMTALLQRGQRRGELPDDIDFAVIVDQAFGFIWYRLLLKHAELDRSAATKLAENLLSRYQGMPSPRGTHPQATHPRSG